MPQTEFGWPLEGYRANPGRIPSQNQNFVNFVGRILETFSFERNLVEMNPMDLPDLFRPPGDQNKSQKI